MPNNCHSLMLKKLIKVMPLMKDTITKRAFVKNFNCIHVTKEEKMHGTMRITNQENWIYLSDREIFPEVMTFKLKTNE